MIVMAQINEIVVQKVTRASGDGRITLQLRTPLEWHTHRTALGLQRSLSLLLYTWAYTDGPSRRTSPHKLYSLSDTRFLRWSDAHSLGSHCSFPGRKKLPQNDTDPPHLRGSRSWTKGPRPQRGGMRRATAVRL